MGTVLLVVGGIFAFAASVWWLWGFVGLFNPLWMPPLSPKRRVVGFIVSWLVSILISMVATFFIALAPNDLPPVVQATVVNDESSDSSSQSPAMQFDGFPDRETQQAAARSGIRRFEAYRLIRNSSVIAAYCDYKTQSNRIETQHRAMIDAGGNEAAVSAESEALQLTLLSEINERLELVDEELATLGNAGYWRNHCAAAERGWKVMTRDDTAGVNRGQSGQAREFLENVFIDQRYSGSTSRYINSFGRDGYSECKRSRHDDRWYIGCQLHSNSRSSSPWLLFLLGRKEGSDVVMVNPVNGPAKQIWDSSFGQIVNGSPDYAVAEWASSPVPVKTVLREFE